MGLLRAARGDLDGAIISLEAALHRAMRELMVHAYLTQRDLGDPDALEAARTLAVEVENPRLPAMLEPGAPSRLEALVGAR
jgi:hypothetical protein